MAKITPYNGSSQYTIILDKELLPSTSVTFQDGDLVIAIRNLQGVQDTRVPPGGGIDTPKRVSLTLRLKKSKK